MLGLEFDDRKVPKLQELEEALRDLCLGEGRKAVMATRGKGLLLAPGCSVPPEAPEANLAAVTAAVSGPR